MDGEDGVLHGYFVAEYCSSCRAGTMGRHPTHSAWWLVAIRELPESWYRASGGRRWGYCMATVLPNIALFVETGHGGHSTHSAWRLLASEELPESWWRTRVWRRWGCCMTTMLQNIALFAELGQWGDAQPTLLGGC